jgi:7-cyano-7-deazaguanine synthase
MAQAETAVLFSSGLDSAVLVADEATRARVHPLYVSVGLAWEAAEVAMAERLLATDAYDGRVEPLQRLEFTMQDVYPPTHWAIRGTPPAYDTPDEDVYLPGRNLVLLAKGGTWCARHGVSRLVLGPLAGNPFPDARPEFLTAMSQALSLGLDWRVVVEAPYRTSHKEQVIARGVELRVPFELTLSCMNPVRAEASTGGSGSPGVPFLHCGACSKCRERREAFAAAGVRDPTPYRTSTGPHEGATARGHPDV